jgi:VWFA-related protein
MSASRSSGPRRWLLVLLALLVLGPMADLSAWPARRTGAVFQVDRPQAPDAARPQATYKLEVNYVELTARVTDAQGHFVSHLSKDDFRVFEDGMPQTITDFGLVNLEPPEQPEPVSVWRNVEPDVSSNAKPFDGRLYVLVLDDLHVEPRLTGDVGRGARRFIEHYLTDGDMAAVVSTSGQSDAAQELTTSRQLLLAAIDKFTGLQGVVEVAGGRPALAGDALSSLRTLTEVLGAVRGRRKAVVYFSEGPSLCLGAQVASGTLGVLNQDAQAVVAAAARANVAIYSIDPRGLDPSIGDCDLDAGIQSLRGLSGGTGGFALVNTNDLEGGFERIRQDNSAYYVLGYYPADRGPDGTFRKIEVGTSRPGLEVRARQGYVVPPRKPTLPIADNGASPILRDALNSVLPEWHARASGSSGRLRCGPDATSSGSARWTASANAQG